MSTAKRRIFSEGLQEARGFLVLDLVTGNFFMGGAGPPPGLPAAPPSFRVTREMEGRGSGPPGSLGSGGETSFRTLEGKRSSQETMSQFSAKVLS